MLPFAPSLPPPRILLPVFTVTLLALLASKGPAFLPGLHPDDFGRLFSPSRAEGYLAQGRFIEAALAGLANRFGPGMEGIWWPSLVLLLPVSAAAISLAVCRAAGEEERSALPGCVAGAFAASWPLWTELFTFRTALPAQLGSFAGLLGFLLATGSALAPTRRLALGALSVVVILGSYQPMIGFALAVALVDQARLPARAAPRRRLGDPALLALLAGCVAYLAVTGLALVLGGASSDLAHRGGAIPAAQVTERLGLLRHALPLTFGAAEPTLRGAHLDALLAVMAVAAAAALPRAPLRALAAALIPAAVGAAALLPPMLLSILWLPARLMPAGGFALALCLAMLISAAWPRLRLPILGAAAILAFLQAGASSQMLLDQLRMNRWDLARAAMIAADVLRETGGRLPGQLVILGSSGQYALPARGYRMERSQPALYQPWSVEPAFREATGMPWSVTVRQDGQARCGEGPFWPQPGAIRQEDGSVFVCLDRTW